LNLIQEIPTPLSSRLLAAAGWSLALLVGAVCFQKILGPQQVLNAHIALWCRDINSGLHDTCGLKILPELRMDDRLEAKVCCVVNKVPLPALSMLPAFVDSNKRETKKQHLVWCPNANRSFFHDARTVVCDCR
jgi:hypothetical protein